ncbi:cation:proton antiporter [Hydrogenimonas urashimensis]|uniref:cation:proton antiporter n=1 Tax=Hydrogenimonas urashimensis TaxID=2740515 RepID=UPI001916BD73|nr:cation:proton antiporter [Hydrogenimonas urashimensis]
MHYLPIILLATFLSVVINLFLKRFNVPTVIGYIMTGIAVTAFFDLHRDFTEQLHHIAEFGIVFLMFTIGLEFSYRHLIRMKREVFLYGTLQLLLSALIFGFFAYNLGGLSFKGAIITGLALGLSSTAIVLKMLGESGQMHAPFGRKAVGILIFQDMAVIPILLMITIFSSRSSDLGGMLWQTFIDAVAVAIVIYLVGKYLLEWVLAQIARANSTEIFLSAILLIVIGAAQLAHFFGFSYSLGAFLAGMMLAETHYKYKIEAELVPFRDLLLGLFFVTVGMQIDLPVVAKNIGWILGVAVAVMALKFATVYLFLRFFTRSRVALKTALALAQVGEFALAVFALAQANGLLDARITQIMLSAIIVSMVASVFILARIRDIADRFSPEPEPDFRPPESAGFHNHVIVCGYGPLGRKVCAELKRQQASYLVLEHDIHRMEEGQRAGEPIFFANAANEGTLRHFNAAEASAVIVAVDNAKHLRLICEALDAVAPEANVVAKAKTRSEAELVVGLNVDHVVIESEEMARLLVAEAMRCRLGIHAKR